MNKVELMARIFTKKHNLSIPVNLKKIAKVRGIKIAYIESNMKSATYYEDEDDKFIILGDKQPIEQERFTLCHELSHEILKHDGNAITKLHGYNKKNESLADAFAAELLMPKREVKRFAYKHSFNVRKLAEIFVVSEQAMYVRMQRLNLECNNCRYNNTLKYNLHNTSPAFK